MRAFVVRFRRFQPFVVGLVAMAAVVSVVQLSSDATSNAGTNNLADGQRGAEQTASRGAERTSDAWPSADILNAQPIADQETTTTTAPPPTTAAPTTAPRAARQATTTTAAPAAAPVTVAAASAGANSQQGVASYYLYKPGGCAHKTLPKGTVVTVTNLSNGKSTTCVVNDRGPFIAGRIIDLDTRVFKQVASTSSGVFTARISW